MPEPTPEIAPRSRVTLHVSLTLPDGTEALSTFDEEPLELVMGDGTLTEGLELALYGLKAGEEQTLELEPGQAYGGHDESLIQTLPRSDFGPEMALEPGLVIAFTTPSGEETPGLIREVNEDSVEVDLNHPLAGRRVVFRAKILEVEPAAVS